MFTVLYQQSCHCRNVHVTNSSEMMNAATWNPGSNSKLVLTFGLTWYGYMLINWQKVSLE